MKVIDFDITLQPKQAELRRLVRESRKTRIGFGGSRGGGKSDGGRKIVLERRFEFPGTNGMIIRRTWDDIYKNHLEPMFRQWPVTQEWWHAQHKELRIPNGSKQYFMYAEHMVDIKRLSSGPEFADIVVEEAEQFKEEEMEFLTGCCRYTGPHQGLIAKMLYTFMPGGDGHAYLKRVFHDQDYRGEEKANQFAFIQAYGWDNVEWSRSALIADGLTEKHYYSWSDLQRREYFVTRSEYGRWLNGLKDEHLRKAWLDGSWDVFEGQVFPELTDELHNLDRWLDSEEKLEKFVPGLNLIGGMDYASTGVTACIETGVDADENLFGLDEYYERDVRISQSAAGIRTMLTKYGVMGGAQRPGLENGQEYVVIDPSTEAKTLQNKHEMYSVQSEFGRFGLTARPARRSRIDVGISLLHEYLAIDPEHRHPITGTLGSPRFFISKKRCPNLWREMKELQRKLKPDGTFEYVGSDHAVDPARYIAESRPEKSERKKKDFEQLPTQVQFAQRAHQRVVEKFDGKTTRGNTWFGR